VFEECYERITKHNQGNHSWTAGLNYFSDLTCEEIGRGALSEDEEDEEDENDEVIHYEVDVRNLVSTGPKRNVNKPIWTKDFVMS